MRITRQRFIHPPNPSRPKINTVKTQQSHVECVKRHISKDCHKRWSAHLRDADRLKFVNCFKLKVFKNTSAYLFFIFAPSSLILLPQSCHSPLFCLHHFTPLIEILLILSICAFLTMLVLLLSPAVPRHLCASLHPLSSPLSVFAYLYYFLLAHFIHHAIFFANANPPSPHLYCARSFLLPFIHDCCLPPNSSTAPPLTSYPSFAEPQSPPSFVSSPSLLPSALWTQTPFSLFSLFHHFVFFTSHPFAPCIDDPFLSPSFSTPPSLSLLFPPCLCGLQAYLPPRRQAAVGEVWKPALSRLSDLPRRASCLTSKGNE